MANASIDAHKSLIFKVDPYDINWGYRLRTQTTDTFGGRVVQLLGVELTTLSVSTVAGSAGYPYIQEFMKFFRDLGLWQQDFGKPARFNFPSRGYAVSFWAQNISYENSLDNVVYPIQFTGVVQEDLGGGVKKAIMTDEIKRLQDGIGYTKNKYNDPETGDANIAERKRLQDSGTVGGTTGGSGGTPAGNFVFYKQGGSTPWGPTTYITDTYGFEACFPSSMAMVIATLKDKAVTPQTVGDYMRQQKNAGGFDPFDASVGPGVLKHFGVTSTGFGYDVSSSVKDQIMTTLQAGGFAIVSGQGSDPFTSGGHFIVLRSIMANGQIMTGNSANFDDSKPYSQDQIFSQYHSAIIIPKQ